MAAVLRNTGVAAEEIGHVHAHGLSTRTGDVEEARAVRQVFGDRTDRLPVVAAKSHFGNLGAGSGIVELVASVMAFGHGGLFPILNYDEPDPECPIAGVSDPGADPGKSFVNLNVTPQGQAAAVLVRSFEG